MKKLLIILLSTCLFLPIITPNKSYAASNVISEIVMELNTGRVVHESNSNVKKYMASTTKILTAIVIIENCDLDKIITVSSKSVGIEGSSIYLEVGEKISVKELLYGLMLRSGNDCAETLALHCSGSIENFSKLMNDTAIKIGANNSNFTNPHGLHDDNHYTTAYDLALISRYAMKNQTFREIVSTKKIAISNSNHDYKRILINKNKMLSNFDGSNGIKTGYTKKAGRCLVSSANRDGLEFICVVLNCAPMFERSIDLLSNAFNEYKNYKLFESDHVLKFIDVQNSNEKCGVYIKNDVIIPLTNDEYNNLDIYIDLPKTISNSINKDEIIGSIKIFIKNNLIFEEKIYTIIDVKI